MLTLPIRKSTLALAMALLIAPILAACGPSRTVAVAEETYKIAFEKDRKELPAGDLTFNITNNATDQVHEFVIFQSDLPADQLPLNSDGNVDEEGKGVTHIDEVEDIGIGETKTLKVNLPAGNYVAICNLPGHYKGGMYYAFTVK
jgi:uncharacterized cupredoxin-like copper-binding protein